jgi:hypothetical protein
VRAGDSGWVAKPQPLLGKKCNACATPRNLLALNALLSLRAAKLKFSTVASTRHFSAAARTEQR